MPEPATADPPERVLLLGASGTIGRATLAELRARSHGVVCLVRPGGTARLGPLPEGVTVREADLILVLEHGRVVERGRHDELLALGGHYAALNRAQQLEAEIAAS